MGSGRDHHRLPFSAHGLLRAEIRQGKTLSIPTTFGCLAPRIRVADYGNRLRQHLSDWTHTKKKSHIPMYRKQHSQEKYNPGGSYITLELRCSVAQLLYLDPRPCATFQETLNPKGREGKSSLGPRVDTAACPPPGCRNHPKGRVTSSLSDKSRLIVSWPGASQQCARMGLNVRL